MPNITKDTERVIHQFNQAFLLHDPAQLESLIAPGCVLENTTNGPDGDRHVGRDACLAVWQGIARNREGRFELEETRVMDEHATIFWRYSWGAGAAESVRGVNLMRVRDGLIVEGRGYVKAAATGAVA